MRNDVVCVEWGLRRVRALIELSRLLLVLLCFFFMFAEQRDRSAGTFSTRAKAKGGRSGFVIVFFLCSLRLSHSLWACALFGWISILVLRAYFGVFV